ncbi:hypothetical protein SSX86_007267 [Deinandra increscens subsp. villosa]|uniref:Histone deacetylase interacting domain-containing protein n=1 Tax=Deinandra increscens subsp. villosa TaxID=3103831 RepID=A0AAP0H6D1_9ASTR
MERCRDDDISDCALKVQPLIISEQEKARKKVIAYTYLKDVKDTFHDKKYKYKEFIDVLTDFMAKRVNKDGVIARAKELFEGHPKLMLGFNTFLPKGYETDLSKEDEPQAKKDVEFEEVTMQFLPKIKKDTTCHDDVDSTVRDVSADVADRYHDKGHKIHDEKERARMKDREQHSQDKDFDSHGSNCVMRKRKAASTLEDTITEQFHQEMERGREDDISDCALKVQPLIISEQEKARKKVIAYTYLKDVKDTFHDKKYKYTEFVNVLTDFMAKRVNKDGVIARAKELFEGHPKLMLGFNTFLPKGYEADLSQEDEPQAKKDVEFEEVTMQFLPKIKMRFQGDDHLYKSLLNIMRIYLKDTKSRSEVHREVAALLHNQQDLLNEFTKIFPVFSAEASNHDVDSSRTQKPRLGDKSSPVCTKDITSHDDIDSAVRDVSADVADHYHDNGHKIHDEKERARMKDREQHSQDKDFDSQGSNCVMRKQMKRCRDNNISFVKDFHDRKDKYAEFVDVLKDFNAQRVNKEGATARVKELFEGQIQIVTYLKDLKDKFYDKMDKYSEFFDVLKDFNAQRVNTEGLIARVKELFRGHPKLIVNIEGLIARVKELFRGHPKLMLGFNTTFLPMGCETILSQEDEQQAEKVVEYEGAYLNSMDKINEFMDCSERNGSFWSGNLPGSLNSEDQDQDQDQHRDKDHENDELNRCHEINGTKNISAFKSTSLPSNNEYQARPVHELDLSDCEQCTPSYRILPKNCRIPSASQRTKIGAEVLNDHWVSVNPRYSFKHMRKNQYEECLFRCEDDRVELDMLLETVNVTARRVEELLDKINNNSIESNSPILLEDHFTALNLRLIERLYGDNRLDVMDVLKKNVSLALPILGFALHFFLGGDADNAKYEDECRTILGTLSFPLFTLDKLIYKLSKQVFDVLEFPKQYILRRWSREVVPNVISRPMVGVNGVPDSDFQVDAVVRVIIFSAEYVVNKLVKDMEKLCSFRDHLKEYMSTVDTT